MERIINTGLTNGLEYEILQSVFGQMSDGIWENSPAVEKYWKNAKHDMTNGEVVLIISERGWDNPYRDKTDLEIKKYFANKIKQIVKKENEYYGDVEWSRDNNTVTRFMGYILDVTVADAYRVYDILSGRKPK